MNDNYVVSFSNLQIFSLDIQPDHYGIKAGYYYNIKDKYFKNVLGRLCETERHGEAGARKETTYT